MARRAVSRSLTAAAKTSGSSASTGIGSPMSTSSRVRRGHQRWAGSSSPGAAHRQRHHRHTRARRGQEGAQVKRQQPRWRDERALGKHQQRAAALHRIGHMLGVGHALAQVEAFDELHAQSLQRRAQQGLRLQFALGDEGIRARQCRHQDHAVEVAGVVADEHAGAVGQMLDTAHAAAARRASRSSSRAAAPPARRQAAAGSGASRISSQAGGASTASQSIAQSGPQHGAHVRQYAPQPQPAAPSASRSTCRRAVSGAAPMPPASNSSRQADRRILPLEVFSTVCGGASTTSSGGSPMASITARDTASRSAAIGGARAHLGQHHQPLGAGCRVGAAEHGDAALAHAVDLAHGLLDLLGVEVAPAADDDVLDAAGDVDLAVGDVGAVAGVEPAVVKQLGRLRRVAEVAVGRRRALELEPAFDALGHFVPGLVDDAHRMTGQRTAAADEAQRAGVAGAGRHGPPFAREGLALHRVDGRHAPERREQQPDRRLGQAVDRCHGLGPQAAGGETLRRSAAPCRG